MIVPKYVCRYIILVIITFVDAKNYTSKLTYLIGRKKSFFYKQSEGFYTVL
jgi:hypothetical protein